MNIIKKTRHYIATSIILLIFGFGLAGTAQAVPVFNFTGDPSSSGLPHGNLGSGPVTATDTSGTSMIEIFGFNADPATTSTYASAGITRNVSNGLGIQTDNQQLNTNGTRSEGLLFDFSGVPMGLRPSFVDFQGLVSGERLDIYAANLGLTPEAMIASFTFADLATNMTLIGMATNANTDSNDVFRFTQISFPHIFIAIVADGEEDRARIQAIGVPEPTTLALLGLGLAGIGYRRYQAQ